MSAASESMRITIRTATGRFLTFEPVPWCVRHDWPMHPDWPGGDPPHTQCEVGWREDEDCNGFYDGTGNVYRFLPEPLAAFAFDAQPPLDTTSFGSFVTPELLGDG